MCDTLAAAVDDPTVAIGYRRSNIRFQIFHTGDEWRLDERVEFIPKPWGEGPRGYGIDFCPWTGHCFPSDLTDKLSNILQRRFGVDLLECNVPYEDIPIEYRTEQWWRDRKLKPKPEPLKPEWKKPKRLPHCRILSFDKWGWERIWEFKNKGLKVILTDRIGPDGVENPGLHRFEGRPPHMCKSMFDFMDYPSAMLAYLPWVREYGIRKFEAGKPVGEQDPASILPIRYCPWCGTRLPSSLRPKWEAELAGRGLSPNSPDIPEDLMSELWWRGPDPIRLPKTGEIVYAP